MERVENLVFFAADSMEFEMALSMAALLVDGLVVGMDVLLAFRQVELMGV